MSGMGGIKIKLVEHVYDSAHPDSSLIISTDITDKDGNFKLAGIDDIYTGTYIPYIEDPRGRYISSYIAGIVGNVGPGSAITGWIKIRDRGDQSYPNPSPPAKRYRPLISPSISIPSRPTVPDAITGRFTYDGVGTPGVTAIIKSGVTEEPETEDIQTVASAITDDDGYYGFDSLTEVYSDCAMFIDDSQGRWFFLSAPSLSAPRYAHIGRLGPGSHGVFNTLPLQLSGYISGYLA